MHNLTIEMDEADRINFLAMVAAKTEAKIPGGRIKSAILHANEQNCWIEATVFESDKAPLKFDREGH